MLDGPVDGRLVLAATPLVIERPAVNLGLEGEVGSGPWSAGVSGWALGNPAADGGLFRRDFSATGFARVRLARSPRDTFSLVVGENYRYSHGEVCVGPCGPQESLWLILGLAWHHETAHYWLRVTPQVEVTWDTRITGPSGGPTFGGFTSWGLPWAEGGLWLTPTFGLGARIGPGIAQAVWRF